MRKRCPYCHQLLPEKQHPRVEKPNDIRLDILRGILQQLKRRKDPMTLKQISMECNIPEWLTEVHLKHLEKERCIKTSFRVTTLYEITIKGESLLGRLNKTFSSLRWK